MEYEYVNTSDGTLLTGGQVLEDYNENASKEEWPEFEEWLGAMKGQGNLMTIDDAFIRRPDLLAGNRDVLEEEFAKMKREKVLDVGLYQTLDDYLGRDGRASKIAARIAGSRGSRGTFRTVYYHTAQDGTQWASSVEISSAGGALTQEDAVGDMKCVAPEYRLSDVRTVSSYGAPVVTYAFTLSGKPRPIAGIEKAMKMMGYRIK